MKPSDLVGQHRDQIRQIILNNHAVNPRIFGSVARGDDTDESDLDILVDSDGALSLMDVGRMRHQIISLIGIEIDLLTPNGLPESFRQQVLIEAVPL